LSEGLGRGVISVEDWGKSGAEPLRSGAEPSAGPSGRAPGGGSSDGKISSK